MLYLKKTCFYFLVSAIIWSCRSKSDRDLPDPKNDSAITFVQPILRILPYNKPVQLEVTITHDVDSIAFYLDGQLIDNASLPHRLTWTPVNIDPGSHKLKAVAFLAQGNKISTEIEINLKLVLGDRFKGGTVFHIDSAGIHGLIAADNDLEEQSGHSQYFSWGSGKLLETSFEDGTRNTEKLANQASIVEQMGFCFKGTGPQINGFGAWYIPSLFELETLRKHAALVGGFSTSPENANYWSSTERNERQAFCLNFVSVEDIYDLKTMHARVRPIRKF